MMLGDGIPAQSYLACPFCLGALTSQDALLVCPEGTRFAIRDGIYDLYLPRCDCGGTLEPAYEAKELRELGLECSRCGSTIQVEDRSKVILTEREVEMHVARDKRGVEDEWNQAAQAYWTVPIVASDTLRRELLPLIKGRMILDAGTGPGLWIHYLQAVSKYATIVATDISMPMLRAARAGLENRDGLLDRLDFTIDLPDIRDPEALLRRTEFIRADLERPPFRDNVFDSSISFQALQYVNQRTSIPQLIRIAKPGGRILIGTQPGSEACGYLEYDADPDQVNNPRLRKGLGRRLEAFEKFLEWFNAQYPRQAMLFREGWGKGYPRHPLDLFLDRDKGNIKQEQFEAGLGAWEAEIERPLDPTKHSCCYGEKRFAKMIEETTRNRHVRILEAGTRSIPMQEARQLDPDRANTIDPSDSWDQGIYLHLYGIRYAALMKTAAEES
jgi:SAM-dependent methyltransferase